MKESAEAHQSALCYYRASIAGRDIARWPYCSIRKEGLKDSLSIKII